MNNMIREGRERDERERQNDEKGSSRKRIMNSNKNGERERKE